MSMKTHIVAVSFLFFIFFSTQSCNEKERVKLQAKDLLSLHIEYDTTKSNGPAVVKLEATLLKESDYDEIVFTTTSGVFASNAKAEDTILVDDKTATAFWTPGDVSNPVFFTVYLKGLEGYTVTQKLELQKVYPDSAFVYSSIAVIYKDSVYTPTVTANTVLHKASGSISNNLQFRYKVFQQIGATQKEVALYNTGPFSVTDSFKLSPVTFSLIEGLYDTTYPVLVSGKFLDNTTIPVTTDTIYFRYKP